MNKIDYSLYLVTDSTLMHTPTLAQCVEEGIRGGCTVVQLREKHLSTGDFYHVAMAVREVTTGLGVPLIINDRADIALAVKADGLHIGQTDLPYPVARSIMGSQCIIGVSASNLTEALAAEAAGADYIGVGAMFATLTKTNAEITTLDTLKAIRAQVSIPIVVIGGINQDTIPLFKGIGIDGIAVVSAIVAQPDVTLAAQEIKQLFEAHR